MEKRDILNKLNSIKETLKNYFRSREEIVFVYVFGSVAKGICNKLSDIDIAIFIDEEKVDDKEYRYGYQAEVMTDIMDRLKTNKVDLVILNYASVLLKHRVIYYGKLIYSKDESKRIRFEIDSINKYMDYKLLNRKIS